MTTSSEDVLLQMGEVRYKKGDGTLYVMNERLAWMAENRDTVAVSHRFADIKMQKISPEGKPKVQLQVVLHDGNSSTFHFVNRNGQQATLEDRDKVKELLQQLLPNFKRKVDKELEEKNRILCDNPSLLQLYKDLVITQVVSSDEFWSTHAKDFTLKKGNLKQDIGVSGAFLADIKPQTDGCNGLRYNLSPDIIHSIFKTYPAVKRKHLENVPSKMTEAEFWTKFFQSHYFHRDRITTGTKDIFTECGKIDDQTIKSDIQRGPDNHLLDLKRFTDVPLEEGFCSVTSDTADTTSGNTVYQNMIKRFNQHSIMVLKTCTETGSTAPNKSESSSNGLNGSSSKSSKNKRNNEAEINGNLEPESDSVDAPAKRQRILAKIEYEDLGDALDTSEKPKVKAEPTNIAISNVDRYLQGLVTTSQQSSSNDEVYRMEETQYNLKRISKSWLHRSGNKSLISSAAAVNALGELSPGGALMRSFQEQSIDQTVPPEFEKKLRNIYISLHELLKHFWMSFPPTTPEQEKTVIRMHEALQRFKHAKLDILENQFRSTRELSPLGTSITQHINLQLTSVNTKFASWQERKMRQYR